jgi:DNA mismatch repair protein MSH6
MASGKGILGYFSPASNGAAKSTSKPTTKPRIPSCKKGSTATPSSKTSEHVAFNEFDIVWGQIEGHPWWPAMITEHPGIHRLSKGLKVRHWHVQFFGNPPTRGWVQEKFIHPFSGLNDENAPLSVKSVTPDIKAACQEAEKAIGLTDSARRELVVFMPSDDEDGEDVEMKKNNKLDDDGDDDDDDDVISNRSQRRDGRKRRKGTLSHAEKKKQTKRKKRIIDDDSEDEYQPTVESSEEMETASLSSHSSISDLHTPTNQMETEDNPALLSSLGSPSFPTKPPSTKVQASTKAAAQTLARFNRSPSSSEKPKSSADLTTESFLHDTLSFLEPGKQRDKAGHLPTHPQFNPRTLYVPVDFLKKQSPGMQQWWTIKSDNFDTVLFFKVGKFYELYHMDAVTGVKELGLVFMKGSFAHAGFPEISFGRYSDSLIEKGYKIGRVEQTETPQMMEDRIKKYGVSGRTDRVVRRELCAVVTKGTRTYGILDGDCSDCSGVFLMAITEKPCGDSTGGESVYGVCFVDTSIGQFQIGQFTDDRQCSRLRTLLAHYSPAHLLYEKNQLSEKTMQVFNNSLATVMKEALLSGSEFWSAHKLLKFLAEGNYFNRENPEAKTKVFHAIFCILHQSHKSVTCQWPAALQSLLSESDSLGLTAHDDWLLGLSALGAITW